MSNNRFSVKPETRGPRIDVWVWPTYGALRARARGLGLRYYRKCLAFTQVFAEPQKGMFAEIHLCEKALSAEIVSHEAAHAVLGWAHLKGFAPKVLDVGWDDGRVTDHEERLCYALGKVVQDITTELWDRGYYGRRPEKETK